ncbi:hypothetical protein GCM10025868_01990 [Angustibacter aerolatus]|uniref:N-acetyltransferase domain-containing protein n=1 Tax=Angustibacter aerolatus TaxID=1162965 RepID=A0ABQ6JCM3_9ACTN|nr:hypothetical protein [Angustibacter aerolatus]GMA84949.1 hypothetical protein GCM10025868_01990 [Angustibacter aerolatus]
MAVVTLDVPWPQTIETERLRLRPMRADDLPLVLRLECDPVAKAHLGGPVPLAVLEQAARGPLPVEPGAFMVCDRADDTAFGSLQARPPRARSAGAPHVDGGVRARRGRACRTCSTRRAGGRAWRARRCRPRSPGWRRWSTTTTWSS